jgi:long-chain acyl-CoA synthetase
MVTAFLYANAQSRPAHAALVRGNERVSHADLLDRVERLAHGLAARGIRPGDAVALVLPNGLAFVTAFFAVTGLGAIVVPLNPQLEADERDFCFRACDVRDVISDERVVERLIEDHSPRPLVPRTPDEAFVYQFSPGSTGRPKRLARTHGQLWAEAHGYGFVDPDDRVFCAVPLSHTYGMGCCLMSVVRHGATVVFLEEPHPFVMRRQRALELLERERVTVFPGVPMQFRHLADAPIGADLSALRLCFSAGTALPRQTFDAFAARFGVPIRQLYGCTEAGTLTANLDPDPVASFESVGTPVGQVEVRIEDGEIAVSTPALTDGYSDMDEPNRQAFRDGWFLTGDLGRLDGAGRLYVTGRKKLLIDVAGHRQRRPEVPGVTTA